jgi:hypothetical protein
MPQSTSTISTPWALDRLLDGLSEDVRWWHGGGDIVQVVNGCRMLTKDNLILVGVLAEYYNAILELHDQLLDNECLKLGPDTRGALKHSAWDRLSNTTPEGWMEFYKSLRRNCIYFGVVLTPFEAFVMKYSNGGHGLCLCGLGVMMY